MLLFSLLILLSSNAYSEQVFKSPLVIAADNGDVDAVQHYLSRGYPINERDEFGITPLMRASLNGHIEVVRLLINASANVNAADIAGATALHMAARSGHQEIVKTLLAYANLDIKDEQGYTAKQRAQMNSHPKIAELIKQPFATTDLPWLSNARHEIIHLVRSKTGEINTINKEHISIPILEDMQVDIEPLKEEPMDNSIEADFIVAEAIPLPHNVDVAAASLTITVPNLDDIQNLLQFLDGRHLKYMVKVHDQISISINHIMPSVDILALCNDLRQIQTAASCDINSSTTDF